MEFCSKAPGLHGRLPLYIAKTADPSQPLLPTAFFCQKNAVGWRHSNQPRRIATACKMTAATEFRKSGEACQ